MKSLASWTIALIVVGVVACELVARFALGLGTPPLSVAHETIEYMFKPNQDVDRFGNRQLYNAHGMRSGPVGESDRWILAIGDSVLNGGNLTDQDELATTELAKDVAADGVFVGNVSAGSWGPANALAWVQAHDLGLVETAVFVTHTQDETDVPRFGPLNPQTHPTEAPMSAAVELLTRYVAPRLGIGSGAGRTNPSISPITEEDKRQSADEAFGDLLTVFAQEEIKACIVAHPLREEFLAGEPGASRFTSHAKTRDVPVVSLGEDVPRTPASAERLYRDTIHITAAGQAELAKALRTCIDTARVPRASL
ncbi:MAG: hypothetical protein AAGD34_02070 [Pseudomonadota bacterium]